MVKLIAFDLDGTLTQHKTKLDDKNRSVLDRLAKKYNLCMVGAGQCMRIFNQMDQYPLDIIGNYGFTEFAGESVEFHPSGCVTFAILGTKAKAEDKLAFDPDRAKRRKIYDEVCEVFSDYIVFVGGSSSFDMAPKPFNKYYALDLYCKEKGYTHDEVVFVGDDYGQGGNDESVYKSDFGFVCVDDYRKLEDYLAHLL